LPLQPLQGFFIILPVPLQEGHNTTCWNIIVWLLLE
jgi:hypothetical protein